MFFSVLVILMYLSVWLFKLGDNSSNVVKIYIKIQRIVLQSFFIKFQLITLTELALHDITVTQPFKYVASFILSLAFQQILLIELIRAYLLVKYRYTAKQVESRKFDYEKRLMYLFWTKNLEEKEKDKGNIYLVRERESKMEHHLDSNSRVIESPKTSNIFDFCSTAGIFFSDIY